MADNNGGSHLHKINRNQAAVAVNTAAIAAIGTFAYGDGSNLIQVIEPDDLGTLVSGTRTMASGTYEVTGEIDMGTDDLVIPVGVDVVFRGRGNGLDKILLSGATSNTRLITMTGGSLKCIGVTLENSSTNTGGYGIHATGANAITIDLVDSVVKSDAATATAGIQIDSTGANVIKASGATVSGGSAVVIGAGTCEVVVTHCDIIARTEAGTRAFVLTGTGTMTFVNVASSTIEGGEYTVSASPAPTYTNPFRLFQCNLVGFTTAAFNPGGLDQTDTEVETLFNNGVADG